MFFLDTWLRYKSNMAALLVLLYFVSDYTEMPEVSLRMTDDEERRAFLD